MKYDVLHNFISPVTGRILCDHNYILVGDVNNVAIPSSILPPGSLPDLPEGNIWIGDASNRPVPQPIISINNLPNLTNNNLWIGNGANRPAESKTISIDNLPDLGVAILPPFTGRGQIWRGTLSGRPVASNDLSEIQVSLEAGGAIAVAIAAATISAKYGPKPYGNIYLSGNLTPTPVLVNVFAKINGVTTSSSLSDFTSPVSNQLKYTDSTTINTLVTVNISAVMDVSEPDMILGISIYKNGSQILPVNYGHLVQFDVPVSLSLSVYVQFATDDYVEAYISSNALGSVIVSNMSFSVVTL